MSIYNAGCTLHVVLNALLRARRGETISVAEGPHLAQATLMTFSGWHHHIHAIRGMMTQGARNSVLGPPVPPVSDGRHQSEGKERKYCMLVSSVFQLAYNFLSSRFLSKPSSVQQRQPNSWLPNDQELRRGRS